MSTKWDHLSVSLYQLVATRNANILEDSDSHDDDRFQFHPVYGNIIQDRGITLSSSFSQSYDPSMLGVHHLDLLCQDILRLMANYWCLLPIE